MPDRKNPLARKAFFVDERTLRKARRALGAKSDSEAVRTSMERIVEMEEFWKFMETTRRSVEPGGFEP